MFGTLFLKECKQIAKSITYYIFVACMVIFIVSQMGEFAGVNAPIKGLDNYGYTYSEDENQVMEMSLKGLINEYFTNSYTAYPYGFYKKVILSEKKQRQIGGILEEVTGITIEELHEQMNVFWSFLAKNASNDGNVVINNDIEFPIKPEKNLSYEQFLTYMDQVDDLIGGGSNYSRNSVKRVNRVPKTYEQAVKEYEEIVHEDQVTRAFARIFSDYMGIVLGILPVFLAVTRGLRDRRAQAAEVIFSKKATSTTIILSRYLSTIVMILLPLLILSISPTLQGLYSAKAAGVSGDAFAFLKVSLWWLLPTILASVSVGFFFTELTNSALWILVQGIWWFISLFLCMDNLVGNVGWNLIPRFNTVGEYAIYKDILPELIRNRLFYTAISILLVIATIVVYGYKRKGVMHLNGKKSSNRKSKLKI